MRGGSLSVIRCIKARDLPPGSSPFLPSRQDQFTTLHTERFKECFHSHKVQPTPRQTQTRRQPTKILCDFHVQSFNQPPKHQPNQPTNLSTHLIHLPAMCEYRIEHSRCPSCHRTLTRQDIPGRRCQSSLNGTGCSGMVERGTRREVVLMSNADCECEPKQWKGQGFLHVLESQRMGPSV